MFFVLLIIFKNNLLHKELVSLVKLDRNNEFLGIFSSSDAFIPGVGDRWNILKRMKLKLIFLKKFEFHLIS